MLLFLYLIILSLVIDTRCQQQQQQLSYCIDKNVVDIFKNRIHACMSGNNNNVYDELNYVRSNSASEYTRSHELYAYQYYINGKNPFYRSDCNDADFEYIPFLPFSWRVKTQVSPSSLCTYEELIKNVISYVEYMKQDGRNISSVKPMKFVVSSTFNLRTAIGTGLVSQVRRGYEYDQVTAFVTAMRIGHYERIPQCPDLLRKWWPYVVEMPYVPMTSYLSISLNSTVYEIDDVMHKQSMHRIHEKTISFYFSGRLLLTIPENICSVRNAVSNIDSRCVPSTVVRNVSDSTSHSAIIDDIFTSMTRSTFCIIAKGDSYSSSSFYTALHANCIPIVVSDWFSFAYPHVIPYELFVVRVSEEDFLRCATCVLKQIHSMYDRKRVDEMVRHMNEWLGLLSYELISSTSVAASRLNALLPPNSRQLSNNRDELLSFPLILLMLEMRYEASQVLYKNEYFTCQYPHACSKSATAPSVKPVQFQHAIPDNRSHLCKHVSRLIGHYKIVYYMQCVRILWPLTPGKLKANDIGSTDTLTTTLTIGSSSANSRSCDDLSKGFSRSAGLSAHELHVLNAFHGINGTHLHPTFTYP